MKMNEFPEPTPIDLTEEDKLWATIAHLAYLATYVIGFAFVIPLVIWLVMKDRSEFVADQAREALNFQLATFIISFVALVAAWPTCGLSLVIVFIVGVGAIVYSILAGVAANRGERYRYPYTFRLIH